MSVSSLQSEAPALLTSTQSVRKRAEHFTYTFRLCEIRAKRQRFYPENASQLCRKRFRPFFSRIVMDAHVIPVSCKRTRYFAPDATRSACYKRNRHDTKPPYPFFSGNNNKLTKHAKMLQQNFKPHQNQNHAACDFSAGLEFQSEDMPDFNARRRQKECRHADQRHRISDVNL